MKLEKLDHTNPELFLDCYQGMEFLCVDGHTKFVSEMYLTEEPNCSLPMNTSEGCIYVCVGMNEYIPIQKLTALYLIEEG